jgi:hypothetical protein
VEEYIADQVDEGFLASCPELTAPPADRHAAELLTSMSTPTHFAPASTSAAAAAASPSPAPAASTSGGASDPPAAQSSPPSAVADSDSPLTPIDNSPKQQRMEHGCGPPHARFSALRDVRALWNEFEGTLNRRNFLLPDWRKGNKASRDVYNDKLFVYREIAAQKEALGGLDAALVAVQERLDSYASKRGRGWHHLVEALLKEQVDGNAHKKHCQRALDALAWESLREEDVPRVRLTMKSSM